MRPATKRLVTNRSEDKSMIISESNQTVQELCTMGEAMRILGFRFRESDKFRKLGLQPVARVYGDGRSHWKAYDLNDVRKSAERRIR
jgi:hypothetical protein